MIFTPSQADTINRAVLWYTESGDQVFQISGNPGTGKSVVLNEIVRRLGLDLEDIAPMAYTGAASVVMRMKGLINAKTIHSWLYKVEEIPLRDSDGNVIYDKYFNIPKTRTVFIPRDLSHIKLIIIDEAGSVPQHMLKDLINTRAKILVAGDLDQLPPVADEPAFLYTGYVHRLTEIMRQNENSPIIYLSQRAKKGLPIHIGSYGQVLVIPESEVTPEMIGASQVVLCGKNDTRTRLTKMIRRDIVHAKNDVPMLGEKLICRKNNWTIEVDGINLTNGLTGTVMNSIDVRNFEGDLFTINFVPDISPETQFYNVKCNYKYLRANKENREMMKKIPHIKGNLFEFGYAQTVHLAQGSQWRAGMYYEEYLSPLINNNLHYTAITRFSDMLIYVKKDKRLY